MVKQSETCSALEFLSLCCCGTMIWTDHIDPALQRPRLGLARGEGDAYMHESSPCKESQWHGNANMRPSKTLRLRSETTRNAVEDTIQAQAQRTQRVKLNEIAAFRSNPSGTATFFPQAYAHASRSVNTTLPYLTPKPALNPHLFWESMWVVGWLWLGGV